MPQHIVCVDVMTCFSYEVEADSEEEAKDLVDSGELDAYREDIDWDEQEVTVELMYPTKEKDS